MLGWSLRTHNTGFFLPGAQKTGKLSQSNRTASLSPSSSSNTKNISNRPKWQHPLTAPYASATVLEPLVPKEPTVFPSSFTVPVVNVATGEQSGTVELKPSIFGVPLRQDLLHTMVVWHLANRRQGVANTKGRGEVAGSTRKIYKQKGTGNARQGSVRAPHRKGSGAAHGPHPKDWSFKVNKKVRKLAMASALSSKFAQGNLMIVEGLESVSSKTKDTVALVSKYQWDDGGVLIIGGQQKAESFLLSSRNLPNIDVRPHNGLHVYAILKRKHLVISKEALEQLDKNVPL